MKEIQRKNLSAVQLKKYYCAALSLASLFLLVVAGRTIFVSLYAESIPFWDQWDAEGRYLIKPWLEGRLGLGQLFAAHNEHRIFFTRLLSIFQLEMNDKQWDNLVGAYANVLLYAIVPLLLFALLAPGLRRHYGKALIFFVLVALAWLPYGWENTLVGFQSQFYLMSIFSIASISFASCSKDTPWLPAKILVPSILGLFTMATGLLGPITAGILIIVRTITGQIRLARAGLLLFLLISISVVALLTLPHIAAHDVFKPKSLMEWFRRLPPILGWPSPHAALLWPLIWLPSLLTIWYFLKDQRISKHRLMALGLSFWTLMQIAGIAYSRGAISSRYLDTMSIGLVANLWMALSMLDRPRQVDAKSLQRYSRLLPLSVFLLIISSGFLYSTPIDLGKTKERLQLSIWQTINVRNAVVSGDRAYLENKPALHIPYPSADALATMLNDTTLRSVLPASVRSGLTLVPEQQIGAFHTLIDKQGVLVTSCDVGTACLSGTGSWRSQALFTPYPYLEVPLSIQGTTTKGIGLGLLKDESTTSPADIPDDYTRLFLATPQIGEKNFNLVATDLSEQAALSILAPVEVGRLSHFVMWLQDKIRSRLGYPTGDYLQKESVLITSSGSDTGGTAMQLPPQQPAQLEWAAPQGGKLSAVAVLIGNYQNQSNGILTIQACTKDRCELANGDLSKSVDNSYFELPLSSPLALRAGEPVSLRIWTRDATFPLAMWSSGYADGDIKISSFPETPQSKLAQNTFRLTFTLTPQK